MTNAFKSIKQGLTEAIAHSKTKDTETTGVKLYQPHAVNVADLTNPFQKGHRLQAASQLNSAHLRGSTFGEVTPHHAEL